MKTYNNFRDLSSKDDFEWIANYHNWCSELTRPTYCA